MSEIQRQKVPDKYRIEIIIAIMLGTGIKPDLENDIYENNVHECRQKLVTGLSRYFTGANGYGAFSTAKLDWLDSPSKTIEYLNSYWGEPET